MEYFRMWQVVVAEVLLEKEKKMAEWKEAEKRRLSREMKEPTVESVKRLKRTLRFLTGKRQEGLWLPSVGGLKGMVAWVDTNWANRRKTRTSTSAGVLEVDGWKIMVVYDGYEDGVGAFFIDHAIVSTLVPVRQAQSGYGHTGSGDGFPSSSH